MPRVKSPFSGRHGGSTVNYYETLEVMQTASTEVIAAAYRAKARRLHPDVVAPDRRVWAEAEFKKINEAYHVLSDPQARADYDLTLTSSRGDSPGSDQRDRYSAFWQATRNPKSKIALILEYLRKNGQTHYTVIADEMKRLHPGIFPGYYTAKNAAASLSKEKDRFDTPLISQGGGYFSVKS